MILLIEGHFMKGLTCLWTARRIYSVSIRQNLPMDHMALHIEAGVGDIRSLPWKVARHRRGFPFLLSMGEDFNSLGRRHNIYRCVRSKQNLR